MKLSDPREVTYICFSSDRDVTYARWCSEVWSVLDGDAYLNVITDNIVLDDLEQAYQDYYKLDAREELNFE